MQWEEDDAMPNRAKPRSVKTETVDTASLYDLLLGRAAA